MTEGDSRNKVREETKIHLENTRGIIEVLRTQIHSWSAMFAQLKSKLPDNLAKELEDAEKKLTDAENNLKKAEEEAEEAKKDVDEPVEKEEKGESEEEKLLDQVERIAKEELKNIKVEIKEIDQWIQIEREQLLIIENLQNFQMNEENQKKILNYANKIKEGKLHYNNYRNRIARHLARRMNKIKQNLEKIESLGTNIVINKKNEPLFKKKDDDKTKHDVHSNLYEEDKNALNNSLTSAAKSAIEAKKLLDNIIQEFEELFRAERKIVTKISPEIKEELGKLENAIKNNNAEEEKKTILKIHNILTKAEEIYSQHEQALHQLDEELRSVFDLMESEYRLIEETRKNYSSS